MSHVDLTTRISWVHERLSKKKYPSTADISKQFDVSNMVAYRDLDFLKYILKAPLQYDYEKEGHYYTKKFKLPKLNVTEGELVAMLLLDQLRRFYSKTDLDESIGKGLEILQKSLQEHVTIDLASLEQVLQVEIEPFPQVDLAVFTSLVQATRNHESVIIRYFSGQKAVVVEKPCDPYNVMKFKDHWYLVAFCHEKQDYRDFLCSRILEVERTNTTFLPDPDFSLEQHKKDSQLFASDAPPIEVVAEFDKYAAHWIRLRDVHPSQKIVERSDGSLEVSFHVSSMENIVRWILSFGEHARILAPLELQERVRRTISRMNYLYNRF